MEVIFRLFRKPKLFNTGKIKLDAKGGQEGQKEEEEETEERIPHHRRRYTCWNILQKFWGGRIGRKRERISEYEITRTSGFESELSSRSDLSMGSVLSAWCLPILPFPALNFQLLSRLISDSFVGGTWFFNERESPEK